MAYASERTHTLFLYVYFQKQIICECVRAPCRLKQNYAPEGCDVFLVRDPGIFSEHFQSCIKNKLLKTVIGKYRSWVFFVLTKRSEVHTVRAVLHLCLVNKIYLFSKYFITISNHAKTKSTRLIQVTKIYFKTS